MGRIRSFKYDDEKIILDIEISYHEYERVKCNYDEITIFSNKHINLKTNLATRGGERLSLYLLLPRELKKQAKPTDKVKCSMFKKRGGSFLIFEVLKKKN